MQALFRLVRLDAIVLAFGLQSVDERTAGVGEEIIRLHRLVSVGDDVRFTTA